MTFQWTQETVFLATWFLSGLTGLAAEKIRNPEKGTGFSLGLCFFVVYGAAGSSLGMVGYTYFNGKENPLSVVGWGQLVGIRVISLNALKKFALKLLGNEHDKDKDI